MSTISASTTTTTAYQVSADTTGALVFQTGATPTTALTIDTGQRSKFPTTIGVGGATPSTSGSGISFPATQSASSDANTLDDYEEGTFTPTATSSTGNLTSYTSAGTYVKIGKIVSVNGWIQLATVGTAGGALNFGGLPFTALSASPNRPSMAVVREDANTGIIYGGFIDRGTTNGTISTLTNTAIVWLTTYRYAFNFVYEV